MKYQDECNSAAEIKGDAPVMAKPSGLSPYGFECALKEMASLMAPGSENHKLLIDAAHHIIGAAQDKQRLHKLLHAADSEADRLAKRLDFVRFALTARE